MEFSGPPNYPREGGSLVYPNPIQSEGPTPFFPAVCLKTHWDPTAILTRTLPTEYIAQALDPRPWAKICLQYTTSGENAPGPDIDHSIVFPSGGGAIAGPASRYSEAIDRESALRRLDRPLGICEQDQFEPNRNGDMYNSRILVPQTRNVNSDRIMEVSFPKVLMNIGPYDCRTKDDMRNTELSERLFNNTTKQDRYKLKGQV
jgi:hypothetical protein